MADSKYVCMNLMCGLGADKPGPCKRCGQPVELLDEFAPFVPGGFSEGHEEYMRMMAERVQRREQEGESGKRDTTEEDS